MKAKEKRKVNYNNKILLSFNTLTKKRDSSQAKATHECTEKSIYYKENITDGQYIAIPYLS